jgi:hypothetical protein
LFNLLVKFSAWAEGGRDTFPVGRLFEYTDQALIEEFKPAGNLDLQLLSELPTLFVQETSGQQDQVAHIGRITRARINGPNLAIEYNYEIGIPSVPNSVLQAFRVDLDIEEFEFYRTHWAVKDVELYRVLLKNCQPRRPLPRVFRLAEHENIEPTLVSVMMPFDAEFNNVYAALRRTAEAVGLRCRRADDIWENPAVIQDVVSLIDRSKVVICDCTGRNPNVFYEIGIAHTLGREVILITQADGDIPFDLRHLRYVRYLNNGEGLTELSAQLQPRLSDLVQ